MVMNSGKYIRQIKAQFISIQNVCSIYAKFGTTATTRIVYLEEKKNTLYHQPTYQHALIHPYKITIDTS